MTGLVTALSGKEPSIAAGTTAQYWRGDKTMQALDKSAVSLANVDNTSDANKPVSSATATALSGKAATSHTHAIADTTGLQTALDGKQAAGSYAPATHTHAQADVTGLAAALSGKSDTSHSHGTFTSGASGFAPASGGGTVNFLRADGTWAVPAGGGISDGDKGDITVSGSGAAWAINSQAQIGKTLALSAALFIS